MLESCQVIGDAITRSSTRLLVPIELAAIKLKHGDGAEIGYVTRVFNKGICDELHVRFLTLLSR
jgi:hypothetical protein